MPGPATLEQVRTAVAGVQGWLTDDQVAHLHREASAVPDGGRIVEIGSFRGRSTIVLGSAARAGVDVIAIDPHAGNDRGPREIAGYAAEAAADNVAFEANLTAAGVRDRVVHHRELSSDAHPLVAGGVDLLFIDGAHRVGPARHDIRSWGRRVRPGGTMLIHDSFSSVGVTLALLVELVPSGHWRYEGRTGSLAHYRRDPVAGPRRVVNSTRQIAQLGWFVRNVVVKMLIVAGLARWTRLLGHRQEGWPH